MSITAINNESLQSGFKINFDELGEWNSPQVVMDLTGKSKSWLDRHRWAGTGIRFSKMGRTPMYSRKAIEDYFEAREVETKEGK
jgi:hypothetical protein